jgi:hypothetical protein
MESFVQTYEGLRVDNGKKIKGSLLYDSNQACWRIVTNFFDVPRPRTENEFGVNAPEVDYFTITEA